MYYARRYAPQYFLSRLRSWIASATCISLMTSLPSRSAIVRATRITLSYPRAESPMLSYAMRKSCDALSSISGCAGNKTGRGSYHSIDTDDDLRILPDGIYQRYCEETSCSDGAVDFLLSYCFSCRRYDSCAGCFQHNFQECPAEAQQGHERGPGSV